MQQPALMRGAPVRPLAKYKATARQELEDVVTRFQNLSLERLATPDHVAHALLGFARNPHRGELPGTLEPRELTRIALVVLPLHARAFRDQRRRDDLAGVAPLTERAMEHVPGTARFITGAEFALAPEAIQEPFHLHEIVGQALAPRRRLGVGGQDRDGDRVLVHIHPEIED